MKKKQYTKRIISIGIALFCIAALGISVVALRDQSDPAFIWGKLEQEYRNEPVPAEVDTPAIVGKHFTVSANRLNHVIDVQLLGGMDSAKAEESAKKLLVEKFSLYYQAQEAGLVVPDEYLDELIETDIIRGEKSLPNSPEYASFLEGLGMTNEEYWRSQKDELRVSESIGAWQKLKYNEFLEENGYDTNPPNNLDALWEAYYNELKEKIIEQEDVQYPEDEAP